MEASVDHWCQRRRRRRRRRRSLQVHKSEWLNPLAGGLVKTCLLAFYYAITTLFCFLLRYLLRYGRNQRMTFMFFGTFQTASTVTKHIPPPRNNPAGGDYGN